MNHSDIAAIGGVEEHAFVMELVEGETLAGPLTMEQALPTIDKLIDALECARRGVLGMQ